MNTPHVEQLEPRLCMSTYVVTTTADAGAGSLRQAITSANLHTGLDAVIFNIPGAGVKTITSASLLPVVYDPIVIDANTQPGWTPGRPLIEISGTAYSAPIFSGDTAG